MSPERNTIWLCEIDKIESFLLYIMHILADTNLTAYPHTICIYTNEVPVGQYTSKLPQRYPSRKKIERLSCQSLQVRNRAFISSFEVQFDRGKIRADMVRKGYRNNQKLNRSQ